MRLHCFECKVINFTFRRFFSSWLDKYEDIVPLGYIALLEHKKDYENIDEENRKFWKAVSYCSAGMRKYFDKTYNFEKVLTLSDYEETNEKYIEDFLASNDIDSYINYESMKSLFLSVLLCYSQIDKQIIFDFMFNDISKTDIYKKYNISRFYLKNLVVSVRQDYFNILKENDFFKNDKYINLYYYFEKVEKKKDVLICSLIKRRNIPVEEIAKILNISVEKVSKILNHTQKNLKFYLFQIQKLRKVYFPEFSLEELAK